jgi:hypothetical protein
MVFIKVINLQAFIERKSGLPYHARMRGRLSLQCRDFLAERLRRETPVLDTRNAEPDMRCAKGS